jgi:hypothetical protein
MEELLRTMQAALADCADWRAQAVSSAAQMVLDGMSPAQVTLWLRESLGTRRDVGPQT